MAGFSLGNAYVDIKTRGLDKLQRDIANINKQFKSVSVNVKNAADFTKLSRSTRVFSTEVGKATRATSGFKTGLSGVSLAAGGAATAVLGLGTAAATLGVNAVKSAANLQAQLAEVGTISADVAKDIDGFADKIGKLSITTRTSSSILSEGLYQTISAGITDTSEAFDVLKVSADAARAGLTQTGVAVDGITSVINAFGLESSDANIISDRFFKTVELGKTRFEDIASSIGSVAPLASQLGVSYQELLAAGAALTTGGKTLSESFTGLQGIMNAILRPSKEAIDLAEQLGIDFSVTALKAKGLAGFLDNLRTQTGGNVEVMGKLFGRVEGLQAVLALAGNQAETFASNLNAVENAAGATEKAVAIQNETFKAQIDLLKTQLSFALQTIGNELLPVATEALEGLTSALNNVDWESFRADIKSTVDAFRSFIGVVGEVNNALSEAENKFNPSKAGARTGIAIGTQIRSAFGLETDPENLQNIERAFGIKTERRKTPSSGDTSSGAFRALESQSSIRRSQPVTAPVVTSAQQAPTTQPAKLPSTEAGKKLLGSIAPNETITSLRTLLTPRNLPAVSKNAQFTPPPALQTNPLAMTRTPIPGVQGELVAPGTTIAEPNPASIVAENLQPLADLTFPTTLPDDLKTFQDAVGEMPKILRPATEELGVTLGQNITPLLKQAGADLAGSFTLAGSAMEGFATGGPIGALIAAGAELLSMTEGFGRLQEMWNNVVGKMVAAIDPLVSAIADALQPVFEALGPVFDALGEVIVAMTPWFKLLGQILKITIVPFLKILSAALKGLAIVIRTVVNGFISIINGIIGLINKIPGIDIKKIAKVGAPQQEFPDETRVKDTVDQTSAQAENQRSTRASGGFSISKITGESRDILLDAFKPLNKIAEMLGTLMKIEVNTRPLATAFAGLTPIQPIQPNLANLRVAGATGGNAEGFAFEGLGGGGNTVRIENLIVQVENIEQVTPEKIEEVLTDQLDLRGRERGDDIPINRNNNQRI